MRNASRPTSPGVVRPRFDRPGSTAGPRQTFYQRERMGNLDLKAIDDKKTQEAFDWYRDITSKMGGDKAFGSLTFAGITQHVARYALVKV